jgi:hypothetical protein
MKTLAWRYCTNIPPFSKYNDPITESLSTHSLMHFHICSMLIHYMLKQMMQDTSNNLLTNILPCSKYSESNNSFIEYFIFNALMHMLHFHVLFTMVHKCNNHHFNLCAYLSSTGHSIYQQFHKHGYQHQTTFVGESESTKL